MSRTLHVIDQPSETAEIAVLRLSVDTARHESIGNNSDQHAWLLFGGEATRDAARAVGLRGDQVRLLPKPTGLHRLMPPALATPRHLMDQAHRVVCWTEGAAQIASMIGCAHAVRRVNDATLSSFARRIISKAHAGIEDTRHQDRVALRERWGVEENTTLITLIGDRFDHVDASAALMAAVLTHEALRACQPDRAEVRLLCHPLAKRRADAGVFGELLSLDRLLIQDGQVAMPWKALAGCDVALAPDPREAGLSILWAEAMGVPIVTPSDPGLPMLDNVHHLASRSSRPRDLADVLTKWVLQQQSAATPC